MSNTVITNYTDLNGPSTKADSSVVVIVNKDGSLSVDENLLGTLMGTDGSQGAGISVVRVGHDGRPDDATDSDSEDDKVPHVTLTVDSYYDEPNSIIKYDSGAEMLQSLRIETRENSLLGFQNDHCYTPLTSPHVSTQQGGDSYAGYDEPVIEIKHQSPPKTIPSSKKITILEQTIIPPKGRKIVLNPSDAIVMKGSEVLNKKLPGKAKQTSEIAKAAQISEESEESSLSSSGESIQDRDSDSDYKDTKDKSGHVRKSKLKPRILKNQAAKPSKLEAKAAARTKINKNALKRGIKEKLMNKTLSIESQLREFEQPRSKETPDASIEQKKEKQTPKVVKKEKKTPAHVTALLSDMTSLFSTPDVIRRVSTDNKTPSNTVAPPGKKDIEDLNKDKVKKSIGKQTIAAPTEKATKGFDLIPQIDDASLAQILQDTTGISTAPVKSQPIITTANSLNSPGLAGPLSPTLDLLASLQPEEEGLTEDLLMHVAQLVESSENLQEVIDKQVLGKVDTVPTKAVSSPFQQAPTAGDLYTPSKSVKTLVPRKDPIEIIRRDGRVITLPPIEAPATRASKRKSQMESATTSDVLSTPPTQPVPPPQPQPVTVTPEPQLIPVSKQYTNKKLLPKKEETIPQPLIVEKAFGESQDSWNSEDDPNRLWCICRQPHNNRFMICCDGCEDWFHGKCVNITKAMGQQMEEQGIEWRCPNCIKKPKTPRTTPKDIKKRDSVEGVGGVRRHSGEIRSPKTSCIVCKKPARPSSIYCSDACILKHAQDSLGVQGSPSKMDNEPGREKLKPESRVIVFERKTGRCLAGINAPTAENLKAWLQKNPTFEVVRPETLNAIKPRFPAKKAAPGPQGPEQRKVQTTLNFEKMQKKAPAQSVPSKVPQPGIVKVETPKMGTPKPPTPKIVTPTREVPTPKTPGTPKIHSFFETPKASTSTARPGPSGEAKKPLRPAPKLQPNLERPLVTPAARRKEVQTPRKMDSDNDSIRENVRKALQEQIGARMNEGTGKKFNEKEIKQFANETESELHELFRDVGVKYKAKYRSLMFNIKDRKNLSLWQKICDKSITPKDLVRLSPEELASQELAEWRDQESKHQLELIKKSELDLLAASKTYVLKTHKGEEVMETKTAVSTELDPDVPVEDVVSALNDSTLGEDPAAEGALDTSARKLSSDSGDKHFRKRDREDSDSHKKSRRDKRDSNSKRSKSSKKRSDSKQRDERPRRSSRRSDRARSPSRERSKVESSKDKSDSRSERRRSRSRGKAKRRSKSRDHSRSRSQGRDRSRSRNRSKRRSRSRDSRRKQRSRSKHRPTQEDKVVRSRSQENTSSKSKTDSTDSDSVERPKSAMMKEVHPEYDPHEPMITSANSEEDLRKSREDVYEDSFKADTVEIGDMEFDSSKTFTMGSDIVLPKYPQKRDKPSEVESDQEPSSTVDHSTVTVWNGCINMVDVARFYVSAHEVSGISNDLEEDLSAELDIVGRINPDTVWDYITKMKRTGNKDIVVLRLQAANDEEKMQYIALYSYLSSRNRLGVVKVSNTTTVKDFYIVPLPANAALPKVLLPLDGPGLDEVKNHLLIAIIIRQRKKRAATTIPKDIIPAKVSRGSRKRSYTPPPAPAVVVAPTAHAQPPYTSPALPTSVKNKIAASLAAADDDEAYSPGSSSNESAPALIPGAPADALRSKMEELNRQIEEQKQQIMKMAQGDAPVSAGDDEAYSPSRPMTPSPPANPLAGIALPSNLHEILATIKQRSETAAAADVDMRALP